MSGGGRVFSWYLIDDVSVIAADAVADAGRDTSITLAAADSAWVGNHDGYVPCRWYTMSGTLIDSNTGGFPVKPTATTSYIMELDVCGHVTRDTVTVRVLPVEVNEVWRGGGYEVFPNPVEDGWLTIKQSSPGGAPDVVVYNAIGSCVWEW